ncbi:MAG: hypothetical protein WCK52_06505 [Betaproteobacteria bacterium]|jgi:hypothetical protein
MSDSINSNIGLTNSATNLAQSIIDSQMRSQYIGALTHALISGDTTSAQQALTSISGSSGFNPNGLFGKIDQALQSGNSRQALELLQNAQGKNAQNYGPDAFSSSSSNTINPIDNILSANSVTANSNPNPAVSQSDRKKGIGLIISTIA